MLTFADANKNATISRNDAYSYGKLASYTFTPSPIAALGTLGPNKTVTVTLWAKDAMGGTVAGAFVYLKFIGVTGGGSAMVGTKALSATPARFATSTTGTVAIAYKTGATVPTSGTETISAGNVSLSPTITASDLYTF